MKCIYLRINTINGKQYVGQTNDFKNRENKWNCMKYPYAGTLIDKARYKYGTENFKTEILKECETQEELNYWEQYYIKELNTKKPNGYNLTDGGDGISGYHFSEEAKKNLSEAHKGQPAWNKGKKFSEESRKKMSESAKGRIPWNKGTKGLQVAWNKGIPVSEEQKRKQSQSMKGKPSPNKGIPMSEEQKLKLSKTVYQYTLNDKLVKEWKSAQECGRNGFTQSSVTQCCNNKLKTHKGYKWSYKPL